MKRTFSTPNPFRARLTTGRTLSRQWADVTQESSSTLPTPDGAPVRPAVATQPSPTGATPVATP